MIDISEIRKHLPHRYPFLLVDRVVELTPGESIVAYKTCRSTSRSLMAISSKSLFFLVEEMAQAADILGFKTMDKTPADGSIYYFVGADKLRFKRPCVPGDRVMLRASILGQKREIWRFEVSSDVDGKLCADR
jgi:3-hydroxyacyl-[acyl-carrier-protein] dehydratase